MRLYGTAVLITFCPTSPPTALPLVESRLVFLYFPSSAAFFWRVLEDFTRLSLFELQHCTCARFLKGGSVVAVVKGLLIASFLSFVGFVPRCFCATVRKIRFPECA